jgi:hypothetical protein
MARALAFLLVLLPALAACGADEPAPGGATGTAAPRRAAGDAITAESSGEAFPLAAGAEPSLRLSGEYLWEEPVVEGGAVRLSRVDYVQDPGFSEWLVTALEPGTATISALGTPACEGEHGCPDEPVRFRVTITVAG